MGKWEFPFAPFFSLFLPLGHSKELKERKREAKGTSAIPDFGCIPGPSEAP